MAEGRRFATPRPWHKCPNRQKAQKRLRRVLNMTWCFWAESARRVFHAMQTVFRTGGNTLKQCFAPCNKLFCGAEPEVRKHISHPPQALMAALEDSSFAGFDGISEYIQDSFGILMEDCFLLGGFRMFVPSGFETWVPSQTPQIPRRIRIAQKLLQQ